MSACRVNVAKHSKLLQGILWSLEVVLIVDGLALWKADLIVSTLKFRTRHAKSLPAAC